MSTTFEAIFSRFTHWCAEQYGKPQSFIGACCVVVLWAATGPFLQFSDTWQLIINTGTTILTWLAMFLLQNTQNRDTSAINAKLDALILADPKISNQYIHLEGLTESEIQQVRQYINQFREREVEFTAGDNLGGKHAG